MDETQRMLDLLNSTFPDISSMDPHEARAAADSRIRLLPDAEEIAAAQDVVIEERLPLRVYRAHRPRTGRPVVFAHGGGFLHGSILSHDAFCRRWARATGSVIVSVGMRLAPEHTAPAHVDDVVAAVDWTVAQGFGPGAIVAGDSSGGNLAAVAALALRDRGDSALAGQVLVYPFLDPSTRSESYRSLAEGNFVTARQLRYYWDVYLRGPAANAAVDWRTAPALATSHRGLPPAIVVTAGRDPLTDEGGAYVRVLREAGVPVLHRHYPEQFHGFLTIGGYGPGEAAAEILWADVSELSAAEEAA